MTQPMDSARRFFCTQLLLVALATPLAAQCSPQWQPGPSGNGTDRTASALAIWDPDGAGPAPDLVVLGGSFDAAGDRVAQNIATFDPATTTWASLGTLGPVSTLAVAGNGSLFAASGAQAYQWSGSAWVQLGSYTNGNIAALLALPNGDLVASSSLPGSGGVPTQKVTRWNGSTWTVLGSGAFNTLGGPLALLPNGDIAAISQTLGSFSVYRWNGAAWSWIAAGVGFVASMAAMPNGDLVVGGTLTGIGGVPVAGIARWNGTTWSALGSGIVPNGFGARTLLPLPNGDLVVGGDFGYAGGIAVVGTARWDGTSWHAMPGIDTGRDVWALARLPNGTLVAAGDVEVAGGATADHFVQWNGTSWAPLHAATDMPISSVAPQLVAGLPNGDFIMAGFFWSIGGVAANHIARWDGTTFSPLGTGLSYVPLALVTAPNGDVFVGGYSMSAGGLPANYIARWDGNSWSTLGSGVDSTVYALAILPNGDLLAGGSFQTAGGIAANGIARWNGTAWSPFGSLPYGPTKLAVLTDGSVVADQPGAVWRWTGSWQLLASLSATYPADPYSPGRADDLLAMPDGSLVVGGVFASIGGMPVAQMARWSGGTWSSFGAGVQSGCLVALPNGDVVAVQRSQGPSLIARWNGSWTDIDSGLRGGDRMIGSIAWSPTGRLCAVGRFAVAGSSVSKQVALLETPCPASASLHGVGCAGSGGQQTLRAASPPWIGAKLVTIGSGLPTTAVVFAGTSATPLPQGVAPLSSLFAQGVAGCDILVDPNMLSLLSTLTTTTGTAKWEVMVPNLPTLIGMTFYHQMVPFETDSQSNVIAITATNALRLVVGSF